MDVRDPDHPHETPEVPEDDDHLADLPDGCGCAEVWAHLSERRAYTAGRNGR